MFYRYEIEVPVMEDIAADQQLTPNTIKTLTRFFESRSDWALIGMSWIV